MACGFSPPDSGGSSLSGISGWLTRADTPASMTPFAQTVRSGSVARDHGAPTISFPPGWHEEPAWRGWWGTQSAVPYSRIRADPSPARIDRDGGRHHFTTTASTPRRGCARAAHEAAGGQDIRIGGGGDRLPRLPQFSPVDAPFTSSMCRSSSRGVRLWEWA